MSRGRHSPPPAPQAELHRPPGAPEWVTAELLADTIATWQSFYPHRLTELDALEILLAVGRLFDSVGDADDDKTQIPGPGTGQ